MRKVVSYENRADSRGKRGDNIERALLNLKEVSEYLGLGETKTREILKDRNCPFSLKIGYRWYANKKSLDKWLQEQAESRRGGFII